jgi:DNA-binding LacI/PurR family transcriptional regulator
MANNISIPEDISIIGYDNMNFIESLYPKPTSVHQSKKKLGNAAGEFLMDILVNKAAYKNKNIKFEPKIVERQSVLKIK